MAPLLRMSWDLSKLWVRGNWPFAIAALLVAQAIASFYWPPAAALGALAVLATIATFLRDWWIRRRHASELIVERGPAPRSHDVRAPTSWVDGRVVELQDQVYLVSSHADRLLKSRELPAVYERTPHSLPGAVAALVPAVVAHRRQLGSVVYDGPVLRLDDDPASIPAVGEQAITMRPARYFDALATNYLTGHRVVSRSHRRLLLDGSSFVADSSGVVRDLEHSWAVNHVGISTLAFTSDDHLVLVHQGARNVSEGDRLAPSGSGSAEPRDVAGERTVALARRTPTRGIALQSVLVRAMERELREECNLPSGTAMLTRVIGFARWIDHGGKPEFYGVTVLDATQREVLDRRVRSRERRLVSRVRVENFDVGRLQDLCAQDEPELLAEMVDGAVSSPLLMALRSLGTSLAEDPRLISRMREELGSRGAWSQRVSPG